MATIWEAEHLTLGSPVAVKFLYSSGPKADEMVGRFMREARVAASVRHRNVIEITDFGVADDKTPYMVMELLEGESLADRLERQRIVDPRFATQIMWLALRGLAAVHDAGIVHRDLKPENIFLVTDSDGTYPKLLDFGVSREAADDDKITREGILLGTPAYMSPEQARGLRDLDLRTDLYSVGVIFYELVAGQLPFESENPGDLIVMITRDRPLPLRTLREGLPDGLYDWVERAMAKDREERFHDAREMRWALAEACREYGFGLDRDTGVSRVSEFPNTGQFDRPRPSISDDIPLLLSEAVQQSDAETTVEAEEPLVEPLALQGPPEPQTQTPLGTPGTAEVRAPRRGRRILIVGAILAAIVGVTAAILIPNLSSSGEASSAEQTASAVWEPVDETFPESLTPPPPEPEPGIHLSLFGLPEGAIARVDGVAVDEALAFIPERPEDYRVEVFAGGARIWAVHHPGNVDGEYLVWEMMDEELAASAAEDGDGEPTAEARPTMRRRGRMRSPRMRRRPRMRARR